MNAKLNRLLNDLEIEWADLATPLYTLRDLAIEHPEHAREIENLYMDLNKQIVRMHRSAIGRIDRVKALIASDDV